MLPLPSLPAIYHQLQQNGGPNQSTASPAATSSSAITSAATSRKRKIFASNTMENSSTVKPEPGIRYLSVLQNMYLTVVALLQPKVHWNHCHRPPRSPPPRASSTCRPAMPIPSSPHHRKPVVWPPTPAMRMPRRPRTTPIRVTRAPCSAFASLRSSRRTGIRFATRAYRICKRESAIYIYI